MSDKEKIEIANLVIEISGVKALRIEKWRDTESSYRAGVEWYTGDDYEFIVEKNSIIECLNTIKSYLKGEL